MFASSLQSLFGSLTPLAVTEADLATILDVDPSLMAGDEPSLLASGLRMLAALALVLGLLVLTLFVLKRFGGRWTGGEGPQGKGVQILHTKPLGGRRSLTVVRWEGRKILLGVTGETISALAQEPDEIALGDEEDLQRELARTVDRRRESSLPRIAGGAR